MGGGWIARSAGVLWRYGVLALLVMWLLRFSHESLHLSWIVSIHGLYLLLVDAFYVGYWFSDSTCTYYLPFKERCSHFRVIYISYFLEFFALWFYCLLR